MSSARNKRLVVSALMLALALVLPYFTGGIPAIGNLLLPMHLPVLLCGFLCGGGWGPGWDWPPPCSAPCWRPPRILSHRLLHGL